MNPTRRITRQEERIIDGKTFILTKNEEMNYSGEWEESGFDLIIGGKIVQTFICYPFDEWILAELKRYVK